MEQQPNYMEFLYKIQFEVLDNSYRICHYNTPWDSERELEDISLMFEGKDINGNLHPTYKTIKWESLSKGIYKTDVLMSFVKDGNKETFSQFFMLKNIELDR